MVLLNERIPYLHCHSEFSNLRMLDCVVKLEDLIDGAVKKNAYAVAITDHENLGGHVRAIQHMNKLKKKAKETETTLPKLVLGNEIYLVDSLEQVRENYQGGGLTKFYHCILLAKDSIGHRQLRALSSRAWEFSFRAGVERVPTIKEDLEKVVRSNKGHLIMSTACLGSELDYYILNNMYEEADKFIRWAKDLFGEDFYLEMQPSNSGEQLIVNKALVALSKRYGVKTIITTDVHYLEKDDGKIHAAYLSSRDDERETSELYSTCYMLDRHEIHEYMDNVVGEDIVKESFANSRELVDKIDEYDLYHPTIVPDCDVPYFERSEFFAPIYDRCEYIKKFAESDNPYDAYLLRLIENGFLEKEPVATMTKETAYALADRINIELKEMWLITEKLKTSISSYYLSVLEFVNIMWEEADSIVGIARGSVTGMYTMYLIGVIQMNPIPYNLPHWRHVSHEKIELSDVDLDSPANRRKQIIEAVKRKRGERKVLNCCTFKTEGSKSAVQTVGRALGLDSDTTAYITSLIPVTRGFTWSLNDCLYGNEEEERKPVKEFINECRKFENLIDYALKIEGLICGRSIHASAVYVFNDDFIEHNALMKAPNGVWVTQFNMKDSDILGGLKMDFLTIQALDSIRTAMDLCLKFGLMEWQGSLRKTYNKYLHPDVLDYDTYDMWELACENKVPNLFQFMTPVGGQAIKKIRPHSLLEAATANSVMRLATNEPGAEQPIDTYVRYKNDINEWYKCMRDEYHLTEDEIKTMEKYLLRFYGVGATQEDVMMISMDEKITNFSVKDSNLLRKSISKKSVELQAKMKKVFFEEGHKIGTSDNLLNYVWKEVVGKQLGYSFSGLRFS